MRVASADRPVRCRIEDRQFLAARSNRTQGVVWPVERGMLGPAGDVRGQAGGARAMA